MISNSFVEASCFGRCLRSNSESSDDSAAVQDPIPEPLPFQRAIEQMLRNQEDNLRTLPPSDDNAARPIAPIRQSVGGLPIVLKGSIDDVVDMAPGATVQDLMTVVEAKIGVTGTTNLMFAGVRLDDMTAGLSDLGICPESIVDVVPMNTIKMQLQYIDFGPNPPPDGVAGFFDLNLPAQEKIFEVPYPGNVCPASWLVEHLRYELIRKILLGHWDQALYEQTGWFADELHHSFNSLIASGEKESIVIFLLPDYHIDSTKRASGPGATPADFQRFKENLEHLQQHHVAIEGMQLVEMASRYEGYGREDAHKRDIHVYYKILD